MPPTPRRILRLNAPRSSAATLTFNRVEVLFHKGRPVAFLTKYSELAVDRQMYQRPHTQRAVNRWRDTSSASFMDTLDFITQLTIILHSDISELLRRATS